MEVLLQELIFDMQIGKALLFPEYLKNVQIGIKLAYSKITLRTTYIRGPWLKLKESKAQSLSHTTGAFLYPSQKNY